MERGLGEKGKGLEEGGRGEGCLEAMAKEEGEMAEVREEENMVLYA